MLRFRGGTSAQFQLGTVVEGFRLIQQTPIPELNMTGLAFEHEKTKAQYFHCATDDTNNVFCIGFCTPNPDSKGLPHILEHTTLCGSDKYPIRDPFFHMLRRSLNTFMNAMTGPDYTMYPFSTVNPTDFNNLLGVYLDAVFHPLLMERDFLQEGHRFEFDNKKNLVLKGVVFNEMKGALANPASYFFSKLCEHALEGTTYEHVMGGCPQHIPDLTHKELVDFQRKHYHPTNSTIVTYGDMNPTEHMKTLNAFLDKMDPAERVVIPLLPGTRNKHCKGVVVDHGPPDPMGDASKSTRIVLSWAMPSHLFEGTPESICRSYITLDLISQLLTSGPASPMYKALIDTHMGSDFAPANGLDAEFRNPLFSFGVQGVDVSKVTEKEVTEAVMNALRDSINLGFPHERVDGLIHQALLSKRHRSSQLGLGIALNSIVNNVHAGTVLPFLQTSQILEQIREDHKKNPHLFSSLIASLFVDNKPQVTLVLHADEAHMDKRQKLENTRVKEVQSKLTKADEDRINKSAMDLAKSQGEKQDVSILPTLRRSDIAQKIVPEVRGDVVNYGTNTMEVITAPCNRLFYTNLLVSLSLDKFTREEVLLFPIYSDLLTAIGAGDMDYETLMTETDRICSGFSSNIHLGVNPQLDSIRCGLHISFFALPERHESAMNLLEKILTQVKFDSSDDKVRTRTLSLLTASASDMINGVPQRGHAYAMSAAASRVSHVVNLSSTLDGLEQVVYQSDIQNDLTSNDTAVTQKRVTDILDKLKSLHKKILSHRAEMWSVCEAQDEKLASERLTKLTHAITTRDAHVASNPLVNKGLKEESADDKKQIFVPSPGEVGYVGAAFRTGLSMCDPQAGALQVGLKILSNEFLHGRVREQGGAYGSGAISGPGGINAGVTGMFSYRDPTPLGTITAFKESCGFLSDSNKYEERNIDEALLGIFGVVDAPRMPSSYGSLWYLHGLDDETRQLNRDRLLSVGKDDVKGVVDSVLAKADPTFVVLGGPKPEEDGWVESKF